MLSWKKVFVSQRDNQKFQEGKRVLDASQTSLWRNRDYLLLLSGQVVSSLGSGISQLAFPLFILALTNSPAQAGFAGTFRTLPYFLLTLPVGALVDRWDRKRVMLISDSIRAINMAAIPLALLLGHLTVAQLYLNALVEGICSAFFSLSESSAYPRVVPKAQIPQAVAQQAISGGVATLLGPPLGGLLYSFNRLLPFAVDAVSYLVSVCSLLFIRVKFQAERTAEKRPIWLEIREGLRWLQGNRLIRSLAFLTALINLASPDTSTFLLIVIARQQHASALMISLLFGGIGLGYLLGSFFSNIARQRLGFGRVICWTCWLFFLFWILLAAAPNLVVLGLFAALFSLVDPIYDVTQFSVRAETVPDELQGRIHSVYRLIALATPPLGMAMAGLLLQFFGAVVTILFFASFLLLMAVAATLDREIRRVR